jgi:NADPH2:quinone reductase
MKAIYIEQNGGIEVLKYGERPVPEPAKNEVLVKLEYSGVNMVDTNHRSGTSKVPLPTVIGSEGAGVIERVGEGEAERIDGFEVGDHVAYTMSRGSYAEYAAVPVNRLVHIPEASNVREAAASMLQGMTAHYLAHSVFPLKIGHTALIHAAAGGTGRLLVQMAAMAGARVIATAGTPAKADLAREAGAVETILYDQQDWVAEVKQLTGGKGVDVVYDSVGKSTFMKSLECLKLRGVMVFFGQASGQVGPVDPTILAKNCLFLTRPGISGYTATRQELDWRARDVFQWIADGKLKLRIDREYPLAEAAEAHRCIEGRGTTGKLLLKI